MLSPWMACLVAALIYPATAVVPAECSFSNLILIWGCLQMCRVTEMETAAPNPYANLTIINHAWPCPVLTFSVACVEGSEAVHIWVQRDPRKIPAEVVIWCFCTSSLHTLAVRQNLLLWIAVLPKRNSDSVGTHHAHHLPLKHHHYLHCATNQGQRWYRYYHSLS